MNKLLLIAVILFSLQNLLAQNTKEIRKIKPDKAYDNILVQSLTGDSLTSSFIIWVKDTVAAHKHAYHSEHIYVLEGKAKMYLNDNMKKIRKGDVIFVPKNNWHAVKVTSSKALKVLSIQSPYFDGKDRILKGN